MPRGRGQRVGHALEKSRWGTRYPPEVTDWTVFQDRDVPKGGVTSPIPEQRPDRKACSLNTVHYSPPPEPTDLFTVFLDCGRAERRRYHPVTSEQRPDRKGVLVLTVTNPMNIASRLIDGNAHGYAVGISTKATELVGIIEGGEQRT